MSVRIKFAKASDPLFAKSKWWGSPDMPEDMDYPMVAVEDDEEVFEDPLTFVCQIRCEEIAAFDPKGLLPHEGMLYFFAALDYALGDMDALCPGMGEWDPDCFRVLYAPSCENLHTHTIEYEDGTPVGLPALALSFGSAGSMDDSFRLLGYPFFEEVRDECPGMISLLQIDENDDWGLRFFDSGMLNFLIYPTDLAARRWADVRCYLHSA